MIRKNDFDFQNNS